MDSDTPKLVRRHTTVYASNWDYLRVDDGPHYIFGTCYKGDPTWITLDIEADPPFDLINDDFNFSNVSAIHCVAMIANWDYIDAIKVIAKAYDALRPGGVMYFGEDERDVDGECKKSLYTWRSLTRLLKRVGFAKVKQDSIFKVTGRITRPRFALKATK